MSRIVRSTGGVRGANVVRVGGGGVLSRLVVTMPEPQHWSEDRPHVLGEYVSPRWTPTGFSYECTTAGTTSGTQPTWPTTIDETVADGTVVWTCRAETAVVRG